MDRTGKRQYDTNRIMIKTQIPQHIGFIVDGNRRWARARGLPTLQGHKRGYERVKDVADWCFARGIPVASFWVFSTENWNRSKREVSYLMNMIRRFFKKDIAELQRKNIRLRVTGRLDGVAQDIQTLIRDGVRDTRTNTGGVLNLCFNYGGQEELVDAMKRIVKARPHVRAITKEFIHKHLYSPELPDLDFLVRTSGEVRTSGFLLWRAAYSEMYFPSVMWPAFSERDLDSALGEYASRERRFGGDSKK